MKVLRSCHVLGQLHSRERSEAKVTHIFRARIFGRATTQLLSRVLAPDKVCHGGLDSKGCCSDDEGRCEMHVRKLNSGLKRVKSFLGVFVKMDEADLQ